MDTEGPEGEDIVLTSQHIELEQSILGTMFVNPRLIPKANENIKKYMFQVENHSMIYEGIIKMADDKKEIDLINFLENYKEIIKLMGGVSYVSEVYSCSSTDVAFETKLELLIKAYKKRLVLNLCSHVSDEMTIEDMENKLSNTLINLYNCTLKKDLNIEDIYDNYLKNLYEINKDMGVKSGLTKIDDVLGNFRRGRLITVFARSGVGKSIFSIQVAKNMALSGHNVIYGSAEMSDDEVLNRMAASQFNIDNNKFEKDLLTDEEKDKVSEFCSKLLSNMLYISTETSIDKFINEEIDCICYNLGYLPGGNKEITTLAETSLKSIQLSLNLLSSNGIMAIAIYRGHNEGKEEENCILQYLRNLPKNKFGVMLHECINRSNTSPLLVIVEKK